MPNSDFRLTREDMVRAAFRRVGIHHPTATQLVTGAQALWLYTQTLDGEGRFLWTRSNTESSITLSSGNRTYAAAATPAANQIPANLLALETFALYAGGLYTPLEIFKKRESVETYLREGTGQPVAVFLEVMPNLANNVLHVFQAPNATFTGKFTARRAIYDLDAADDTPDFPTKFHRALILGAADILAGEFHCPDHELLKFELRFEEARALASLEEPPAPSKPARIQDF